MHGPRLQLQLLHAARSNFEGNMITYDDNDDRGMQWYSELGQEEEMTVLLEDSDDAIIELNNDAVE